MPVAGTTPTQQAVPKNLRTFVEEKQLRVTCIARQRDGDTYAFALMNLCTKVKDECGTTANCSPQELLNPGGSSARPLISELLKSSATRKRVLVPGRS
jgi:hypothetical protein